MIDYLNKLFAVLNSSARLLIIIAILSAMVKLGYEIFTFIWTAF